MLTAPRSKETVIANPLITSRASLELVESFVPEDEHLESARRHAEEVGVVGVGAGAGATLGFLASAVDARAVAEVGTGTGVSGLWLLRGMAADGVLTSVDLEAENQRLAREVFTAAGIPPRRFRLIAGSALDVMPRLTDAGYDLVVIDGDKVEYGEYLDQALRLARPGGLIAFDNALWHDRVADPTQRDPETTAVRELHDRVREDDRLRPVLLPVGDGLLVCQLLRDPVG